MGQPNEIGDLCAYLCSPQAGYLTGQTIVVDGGVNRSISSFIQQHRRLPRQTAEDGCRQKTVAGQITGSA